MEAVEIRRRLADNLMTSTDIDLGVSLCHLANCLYNLNRQDAATVYIEEAVELRSRLDFDSDGMDGSDLRIDRSIEYLDKFLSDLRHREEGHVAIDSEIFGDELPPSV
jgi:hypothetical protein